MSVRSLLPDLGTSATGTPEAAVPPFARAVLWAHGDDAWRGEGGWTVLLDGTDRLRRLSAVDVDLNAGGVSTATITSEGPLDPAAARAAVEEAGYTLVEG